MTNDAMTQPRRLFDCLDMLARAPAPDLLSGKLNGQWVRYSTQQVLDSVYQLAAALLDMGVSANDWTNEGRDKIGLVSSGRPEWLITDLAVQLTGAVLVPLYPNTSAKEVEQILIEAEVKYIFVSDRELYDKIASVMPHVPSLKQIFTFDPVEGATHWKTLLKPVDHAGMEKINAVAAKTTGDHIATIIYTSGTTGQPKGVMLTHYNIVSNVQTCGPMLLEAPFKERKAFSFLPLNHIFEKMVSYIYLFFGFTVAYAESIDTIAVDIKEARPYMFATVPRLLEKVFEKIMAVGQSQKGIKKSIFLWAMSVARHYELTGQSWWYKLKLAIADKLVLSKWREALGGNILIVLVGSSATPLTVEKVFTAAKMLVMEGYGLTETSPVISVNCYDIAKRRFGTVGPLIDNVDVKIADDGEILCKGPNVMPGYYKNPTLTAEVMLDGWFHTGDIGTMDDGKFLKITDRKKEIFKTSGGKYVAPLPIENRMKENRFIEQMMVVGPDRKFTAALIVPSFVNLKSWCEQNKVIHDSNAAMVQEQKVLDLYQSIVDKYNPEFNHVEQVKKITLLPDEWSIEQGELTPTGKMKRRVIMEKYAREIDKIYSENNADHTHL